MPEVSFSVRRIRNADFEPLCEAHIDSIRSLCSESYSPELIEDWVAPIRAEKYRDAVDQGAVFFVAEDEDGRLLGFSETHRIADDRYNAAVFVTGAAARRGVGSSLYQAAESQAMKSGALAIELNASLAAIGFYEANGFHQIEQRESEMGTGRKMPVVLMRKSLTGDRNP